MLTIAELKALKISSDGKTIINSDGEVARMNDGGSLYGRPRIRGGAVVVAFEFRYKFNGRGRAVSCGIWPDTSLPKIRGARDGFRLLTRQGHDPAEQSNTIRLEKALAESKKQESLREEQARVAADEAARKTINDLFTDWSETAQAKHDDGGAYVNSMFKNHIQTHLGEVCLPDVTVPMIRDRLKAIAKGKSNTGKDKNGKPLPKGGAVIANRLYAQLLMMFDFARRSGYMSMNPCESIKRTEYSGSDEISCDRHLSENEIRELLLTLPTSGLADYLQAAMKILLATGCRVGELSKATWANVDLEKAIWSIPVADQKQTHRTKKGKAKPHQVYLSDFAIDAFKCLPSHGKDFAHVFPAARGDRGHMDEKTISKAIRDRQRGNAGSKVKGRCKNDTALILSGGEWSAHDLRRTMATLAGELGTDGMVIEKMLNHAAPTKIWGTYQHQTMDEFQRRAWQLVGERLELLTRNDTEKVVPLRAA